MELNENRNDIKIWAALCHLTAFINLGIPFSNFIVAFTLWLLKKKESDFVNQNGKEAINFQLLIALVTILSLATWSLGIGVLLALIFGIYALFEVVLAAICATKGNVYQYKYSLRLFK